MPPKDFRFLLISRLLESANFVMAVFCKIQKSDSPPQTNAGGLILRKNDNSEF
jgi:hypothetical protein